MTNKQVIIIEIQLEMTLYGFSKSDIAQLTQGYNKLDMFELNLIDGIYKRNRPLASFLKEG